MTHSRKQFLQLSAGAFGALAFSPLLNSLPDNHAAKLKTFGLQLYTIRDLFEKDPKGALKQIAGLGYKQVEGYERASGIFWGMKNTELKKYIDGLGMSFISSHCEIDKDFERKANEAAEIDMKYLIYNWPFSWQPMDEYKKMAVQFNRCGEICRKAGIRFAYHNYVSSFQMIDGVFPHDVLMKETDATLVDHQMDIYWLVVAGQDPEVWFKKYPNRFRLCHIKDRTKGSTGEHDTCDLGAGSIDFPKILKTAKKNGMQYYIAEQEDYAVSSLESVKNDAEYMKRLRL